MPTGIGNSSWEEDEMRTTERDRKKRKRGFATAVVLALLLPLCAGAGEKKWKEAILVAGPVKGKDQILGEANKNAIGTKNWLYVVKVGDYKYVADVGRTGGLLNPKGKPKKDDWQANSTIQVHFHHHAGSLYMDLKNPEGKEETAWVVSKIGPDGKELCGKFKCTKTPGEDED
jgi:hypothetical protein